MNVMPPLPPEQLNRLRESIKKYGVLEPIEITADGTIVEGFNRKAIADELGIDPPTVIIDPTQNGMTLDEYAFEVNVARRHLSAADLRNLISVVHAREVATLAAQGILEQGGLGRPKTIRGAATDRTAEILGVHPRTVQTVLAKENADADPEPPEEEDDGPPTDSLGNILPDNAAVQEAFGARIAAAFNMLSGKLHSIACQLADLYRLSGGEWLATSEQSINMHLSAVKALVEATIPYCLTPPAVPQAGQGLRAHQIGWLPKSMYERLPQEQRWENPK